jgi:hypothetical protein
MRLRLGDATTSAVLAAHYREQAEMCHQMARMTVSPFKEGWLEFAAEWTKLASKRKRQSLLSQKCPPVSQFPRTLKMVGELARLGKPHWTCHQRRGRVVGHTNKKSRDRPHDSEVAERASMMFICRQVYASLGEA